LAQSQEQIKIFCYFSQAGTKGPTVSAKEKVQFLYYWISDGIVELMHHAREDIQNWFKPMRFNPMQLRI